MSKTGGEGIEGPMQSREIYAECESLRQMNAHGEDDPGHARASG